MAAPLEPRAATTNILIPRLLSLRRLRSNCRWLSCSLGETFGARRTLVSDTGNDVRVRRRRRGVGGWPTRAQLLAHCSILRNWPTTIPPQSRYTRIDLRPTSKLTALYYYFTNIPSGIKLRSFRIIWLHENWNVATDINSSSIDPINWNRTRLEYFY